jgi:hypothetical protein
MIFLTFLLCVLDNEPRSRYPKDYNHLPQPSVGYEQPTFSYLVIVLIILHHLRINLPIQSAFDADENKTPKNINSTALPHFFFQPKHIACSTRPLFTGSAHGMLGPTGVSVFCKIQVLVNIVHLRDNVLEAVVRRT